MNFPKPVAILLILGLFIHALSVPTAPSPASPSTTPQERPVGRPSLPAVSQESESIDSFNVHPENRWSESETGPFEDELQNGEFMINTYSNDSAEVLRFRDAETTSGDIETRFRIDWVENTSNGDDFEIDIMGFNVTTDEGSGNSSLNAYPWNSTHYTLRPTFTTGDGTDWRSWNIESEYQDYSQMNGSFEPDGWDFFDSEESSIPWGHTTEGETQGYRWLKGHGLTWGGQFFAMRNYWVNSLNIPAATFQNVEIRTYKNTTETLFLEIWDGSAERWEVETFAGAGWQTLNFDDVKTGWSGTEASLMIFLKTADGNNSQFAETDWRIDYIRLTTTNDSSDLTFFEYESYYRAEMKYDLMESTLRIVTSADNQSEINKVNQGNFKIEKFFTEEELIPDVHLGQAGDTDFLFGMRTAGANATNWWDYYKAPFAPFRWGQSTDSLDNDTWEALSQFVAWNEFNGNNSIDLQSAFNLTVPEFDSVSGKLSLHEEGANVVGMSSFFLYSVNPSTGATTIEVGVTIFGALTRPAFAGADTIHQLQLFFAGVTTKYYWFEDNRNSEASFSIGFDKAKDLLSMQIRFISNRTAGGEEITVSVTEAVANKGNEFIVESAFRAIGGDNFVGGPWPTPGTDEEVNMALEAFDLLEKDIFADIWQPVDDVLEGGQSFAKDPISFLVQAFRDLTGSIFQVIDQLITMATTLTSILDNLVTLVSDNATIITNLGSIITNTGTLIADFTSLLTDTGQMVADFTSLLTDTGSMVSDLIAIASDVQGLPQDFIDLLSDTGDLLSTLSDIFDELVDALGDSWLGLIWDELIGLAVDIGTEIFDEFISRALAIMTEVYTGLLDYIRSITVSGVSIGDVLDFVSSWMANFWNIAAQVISLGTEVFTVWTQVFLMGLLGVLLIWAAASSNGDGTIFGEKFTQAMLFDANFVRFLIDIYVPLGVILLGNLFWVILVSFGWGDFLIPALVPVITIANFHLGAAYEIPDFSDQMDIFFEYMNQLLDDLMDVLLNEVAGTAWQVFVTLLSDDILGVSPAIIVFVISAGIAANILIRGRF